MNQANIAPVYPVHETLQQFIDSPSDEAFWLAIDASCACGWYDTHFTFFLHNQYGQIAQTFPVGHIPPFVNMHLPGNSWDWYYNGPRNITP